MTDLNQIFGIHEATVKLRSRRAEVLAHNLANADTPGYQARDIDFSSTLKQLSEGKALSTDPAHPGHMSIQDAYETVYRQPLQPSLDGNTVDSQVEIAQFTENSIKYEASLNFLNGKIKGILSALRGHS